MTFAYCSDSPGSGIYLMAKKVPVSADCTIINVCTIFCSHSVTDFDKKLSLRTHINFPFLVFPGTNTLHSVPTFLSCIHAYM
jgi:hypothetical protein